MNREQLQKLTKKQLTDMYNNMVTYPATFKTKSEAITAIIRNERAATRGNAFATIYK